VTTNDLNFNLAARQAGISAPLNYHTIYTNTPALTTDGELHILDVGIARTDAFSPQIGNNNFSIKVKGRHDAGSTDWIMLSVQSETNAWWDWSPMNINFWHHDNLHFFYGEKGSTTVYTLAPDLIDLTIGKPYSASNTNSFEVRAIAESATNGTWGFYLDGIPLVAGLPYSFGDPNLKLAWVPSGTTNSITTWDDLEISTIPPIPQPGYVFFDDFNASNTNNANWLYSARQTNGIVIQAYNTVHPQFFSITNPSFPVRG